jgi:hypothetical protein
MTGPDSFVGDLRGASTLPVHIETLKADIASKIECWFGCSTVNRPTTKKFSFPVTGCSLKRRVIAGAACFEAMALNFRRSSGWGICYDNDGRNIRSL